jgi:hypothetical protein
MTDRDTCRMPDCDRPPGQQDRDDYRARRFCSVQCETKHDHLQADAADARRAAEPDPRPAPGREP